MLLQGLRHSSENLHGDSQLSTTPDPMGAGRGPPPALHVVHIHASKHLCTEDKILENSF